MHKAISPYGWPVVVGLLGALLLIELFPEWVGLPTSRVTVKQVAAQSVPSNAFSFADAVEIASPAVVNLFSSDHSSEAQAIELQVPYEELKHLHGQELPATKQPKSSLGSAVLISENGIMLTNNHVVANKQDIVVALKDGRTLQAKIIGSDPETDLAVIKVEATGLPAIVFGDSEKLRTGDGVLAIGNPYGVGQTVTYGIVSGTGRHHLGLNTYEDFIQTDAAINPGNSGGALVDMQGHLVGINTAIFSRGSGSQGIGFAIPAKLALEVMESIIQHGRMVRGWMGLEVKNIPAETQHERQLKQGEGVIVSRVYDNSPAAKGGLEQGDIILNIEGVAANDGRTAMNQVARMRPGQHVAMEVLKQGTIQQLQIEIGVRPPVKPRLVQD
ncbi:S1C family serine protease [Thiopseudomonas alkaliphila]|uniref:S1C family serine protease n=1 Tax=Thiopseudomonas alkaliphila TaxID=1697053 RepID=UPI002574C4D9|nr:trypsin-like peptidase domain-containing protein [Thiopseudomonas alkaliphila]MDM1707824.1 trypsin-like peptidase domain-containing protein [Thiopseudomonas alkaliphila]